MDYRKLNVLFGWITFAISAFVFISTIEPTASFWDCGEFIATGYKLQVGHPPGAPFFMLLTRFFSLFAMGDVTLVAKMVNILSALASAFTSMFLFWTITHLARKIFNNEETLGLGNLIAVIGAGLVGALSYTFSDTFWFSAVEGELYATSSLFTAVVFWAILKWENIADTEHANRWLILTAYLMGISIGVHLLNLLAIPAIVFVYYFKKYPITRNGVIYASIIAVVILGTILYGIIPGIPKLAWIFELIFVNGFKLPYNSGAFFFVIVLVAALSYLIYFSWKKQKVLLNTIMLALTVIIIGYSSYAIILIRSNANPPIDQNNPDNVFDLIAYLNREQYGDRPLMKGHYFNAPLDSENPFEEGKKYYIRKDGKYVVSYTAREYNYDSKFVTMFPRMYSPQENHVSAYKSWSNFKGQPVKTLNNQGEQEIVRKPTFGENISFFFRYQLGHMYFRYFMWNFAGRQNDIQGHGEIHKGNWLSGINFIDEMRLGPQDNLPESMTSNKAYNRLYFLPFILGLIGFFFHYRKRRNDFWVVTLLFFFTGIAIVLYLNQYPYQPRERDYAYAGSFYAFTIWIGLGLLGLYELMKKKIAAPISAVTAIAVTGMLVPGVMASENWDDHDRSNRYIARDFAHNYLNSCEPNAILFTNGDNDTFPLWYAQEVEGIRTDVRVICLPYLSTDWYIDQMKSKAYDSEPIPFSLNHDEYIQGKRDMVPVYERLTQEVELSQVIDFVADDNPRTKVSVTSGEEIDYFPARKVMVQVDKDEVIAKNVVQPKDSNKIVEKLAWKISSNYVGKNDLMILDLVGANNWERPIYFVSPGQGNSTGIRDYFQLEGFASRLVPIKTAYNSQSPGRINTDILYNNYMNKFKWGNVGDPDIYVDENIRRTLRIVRLRSNFARLANDLVTENKIDSAKNVLARCAEILPHEKDAFDFFDVPFVEALFRAKEIDKAIDLIDKMVYVAEDDLNYYFSLPSRYSGGVDTEKQMALALINQLMNITKRYGQLDKSKELDDKLNSYIAMVPYMSE
jgi:Protein O-mannosyl-transferase TMEM260-like